MVQKGGEGRGSGSGTGAERTDAKSGGLKDLMIAHVTPMCPILGLSCNGTSRYRFENHTWVCPPLFASTKPWSLMQARSCTIK